MVRGYRKAKPTKKYELLIRVASLEALRLPALLIHLEYLKGSDLKRSKHTFTSATSFLRRLKVSSSLLFMALCVSLAPTPPIQHLQQGGVSMKAIVIRIRENRILIFCLLQLRDDDCLPLQVLVLTDNEFKSFYKVMVIQIVTLKKSKTF